MSEGMDVEMRRKSWLKGRRDRAYWVSGVRRWGVEEWCAWEIGMFGSRECKLQYWYLGFGF